MRKKPLRLIICLLLAAVLTFGVTGCALFEHNYDKDYQQVVAVVDSISETRTVEGSEKTFVGEEKKIYKSQLVSSLQSNGSNIMSQYGYTLEQATDYLLNVLVYNQLILNEANKLLFFGDIEWDMSDSNAVAQAVYASIDSQLRSIKNEILTEHDEPTQGDAQNSESSTTYPVPEEEEADEEENPDKWLPDVNSYPATTGNAAKKSLEREAVRRLVDLFEDAVDGDFIATDKEKEYFKADITKMRDFIAAGQEEKIYPMLYDPDYDPEAGTGNGTYILEYLVGRTARDNRKMTILQEYITDGVYVSDEEVLEQYEAMLETQQNSYTNATTYNTDMTSDTSVVLYTPNSNYFYVKHILIPFSTQQTDDLTAYKNSGLHTKAEIERYRALLANNIVSYPHVGGENDTSRPMSVNAIFNTIKSSMAQYKYDAREAERLFDSLTYEYNTDTGAFGSVKGYAVKYELADGEAETYMQEFADAAREMYDSLSVGQMYDKMVVTDYGVHIMYLASKTTAGEKKALNDYQTPARRSTFAQLIREQLTSNKEKSIFETWQQETITYYTQVEEKVTKYEKRYKDLYES